MEPIRTESMEENIFHIDGDLEAVLAELDNDELQSFTETYEDLKNDTEVELYIFTSLQLLKRTGSYERTEKATMQAHKWVVLTPIEDEDFHRRYRIQHLVGHTARDKGHRVPADQGFIKKQGSMALEGTLYEMTRSPEDFDFTINIRMFFLSHMPRDNPKKPWCEMDLAEMFFERGSKGSKPKIDDLQLAVRTARSAVTKQDVDPHRRAHWLASVGIWAMELYWYEKDPHVLWHIIDDFRRALRLQFDCDGVRTKIFLNLGHSLLEHSRLTGKIEEHDEAISRLKQALDSSLLNESGHKDVVEILEKETLRHFAQHEDISRAMECLKESSSEETTGMTHRTHAAIDLIRMLHDLVQDPEESDNMALFDRAIDLTESIVQGGDSGHISFSENLHYLEDRLVSRFNKAKAIRDLDRGLKLSILSLQAAPAGSRPAKFVFNLSERFAMHFEHTKNPEDLNQAIELADESIKKLPPNHSSRYDRLARLGTYLRKRHSLYGRSEDYHQGSLAQAKALAGDSSSNDTMKLIAAENLLASHGFSTFDLTPNVDALNNAIDMTRPMADDMPAQLDAALHTSLAHWLCLRIDKNLETTSIDDVNRAISLLTSALDAIDLDDPSRPLCLGNMAGIYMQKFIMLRT